MKLGGTRRSRVRGRARGQGTLGTFPGVFTPSVLTILGIILFLRLGFVVGAAGLGRALLIIGIANLISILTSFSLATIATNLRVKGGGDYYLISRTLGVEFGGALGLVLFAAQSISVAFYAIGFGEATAAIMGPGPPWLPQAVAAAAVGALFVLAWVGADVASRFQYVVMSVLGLALVGFFAGGLPSFDSALLRANATPSGDQSFWLIFAIFFPAVTGFTQGVSMSGDLKDPAKSLPLGTFLAVGVSIFVYFAVALVFAGTLPGAELVADYSAMRRIAIVPWLIDAGVIAATLSSALASFLGAPRILQALAQDRVFPLLNPFAAGHGASENPRRGVLLSLGIALATVALGNLNVIAPVVSMFFLISYGLLNFATYYEGRAHSPSFRPTFRWHHPGVSLAGAVACAAAMLAIDPLAGAVAGSILFGVMQYVRRTVRVARWADSGRSRRLQEIRDHLADLSAELKHPRDWRPVILAFSEDSERRVALLRFASWIEGGSGFVSAVQVLDEEETPPSPEKLRESEEELRRDIATAEVTAFARSIFAYPAPSVLPTLLAAHGLGEVRANTVLVNRLGGDAEDIDETRRREFGRQLRFALRAGCNLIVLDAEPEEIRALDATPVDRRRIDVWYRDDATGRLSLLLAYLTTRTSDWKDAVIRLIAPRPRKKRTDEELLADLRSMLDEVRIHAEPVVVDDMDREHLLDQSKDASLVFLPFTIRGGRASTPWDRPLAESGEGLPVVAFTMAAQDLDLGAEPEEGPHAEVAEALDRADGAEKTAQEAARSAARAEQEVASSRRRLRENADAAKAEDGETAEVQEAEGRARKARRVAERARERADRAREEAEQARRDAESGGSSPAGPDQQDRKS